MKKTILLLMAVVSAWCTAFAQSEVKQPDTYNYQSGVEAYFNGDMETSMDFFQKEVAANPKNGYAYVYMAYVNKYNEQYGQALNNAQKGLKLLPKKDKEYQGYAYELMGDVQLVLGDTLKGLENYEGAFKATKSTEYLFKRCQTFHEMARYDDEAVEIKRAMAADENDPVVWVYAGRLEESLGNYDKAIEKHNYAMKLDADYSGSYTYRAEVYMKQKKYREAVQDIIEAIDKGSDNGMDQLSVAADSAMTIVTAQLKAKQLKSPDESRWTTILACLQAIQCDLPAAEKSFNEAIKKAEYEGMDTNFLKVYLGRVLSQEGKYHEALDIFNQCIENDSTDSDCWVGKANCHYELYDYDNALKCLDKVKELEPDDALSYTSRARFLRDLRRYDEADADIETALALEPDDPTAYIAKAKLYVHQGDMASAKEWSQKALDVATSLPESQQSIEDIVYAQAYLGNTEFVEENIEKSCKDYAKQIKAYQEACIYSVVGQTDKALDNLEEALKDGYCEFNLIANDVDLNNIRDTERFKALVEEYKQKFAEKVATSEDAEAKYEEVVTEVPFTKDAGIYKVKCTINELPLNFYFDTGAADVTISNVEALFMLKNDYLKPSDIKGSTYYGDANGDLSEGTIVLLKKVEFGGLVLDNVKASVVHNQKAPLLLGQTVLSRLGKIEIDYDKSVLKITSRKRTN